MNNVDRYWWSVNKRRFIISLIILVLAAVLNLGFMWLCLPLYMTMSCGKRFLSLGYMGINKLDSMRNLVIMPFSRGQIYKTYTKYLFLQTALYSLIFIIGSTVFFLLFEFHVIYNELLAQTPIYYIRYMLQGLIFFIMVLLYLIWLINHYIKSEGNELSIFAILVVVSSNIHWFETKTAQLLNIDINAVQSLLVIVFCVVVVTLFILLIKKNRKNYKIFVLNKPELSDNKKWRLFNRNEV